MINDKLPESVPEIYTLDFYNTFYLQKTKPKSK